MGGTVSFTAITLRAAGCSTAPPGLSVVMPLCLGGSRAIVHLFAISSGQRFSHFKFATLICAFSASSSIGRAEP